MSQSTLNASWPSTGNFTANFNSASAPSTITIPTTIATVPNNINIGSSNYTFTTTGSIVGCIASPINLNNNLLTLSPISTANLSLSGIISGTGGLTLKGGGVGSAAGGNVVLSAASTYSGITTIGALNNNIQLQLDPLGTISSSPINVTNNSQLYLNGTTGTTYSQGANLLSLTGLGNSMNVGALRTASNNNYTWNGAINVAGNTNINVGSSGILTLPCIINLSSFGLTKEGTGTLVLSNVANNGTGLITINNGTLKAISQNVLFNGSGLSMIAGSIFDLAGNNETLGSLTGNGTITSSASGSPTLTIGSDNTTTVFSGIIQNGSGSSLNLSKTGTGILTFAGINTFSGNTNVNAGTLNINGSLPIGNNVTIASSGILSGNGIINGSTTISGTVSPNSKGTIGTLNSGNTTFNAGGNYYLDINSIPTNGTAGINWDNLVTTGIINNATSVSPFNISINGTIAGFNNITSYSWSIGSYIGIAPSNANISIQTSGLSNDFSGGSFAITFVSGSINLVFTPLIVCSVPAFQPTSIVFNIPTSLSIPVSFTANSVLPSGYLVVRTTNSSAPTSPVNGVIYPIHTANLGGYIELDSNSTSFNSTSLMAGTNYWYWVFAYNNSSCSGGPIYQCNAPLSGMATTAVPTISLSQNTLSYFGYSQGYGPSSSQNINLSASNLSTSSGNLIIKGSDDYLVSTDNSIFSSSISLPYTNYNLALTPFYVQLKAGLNQNIYNGEIITISSGSTIVDTLICNGSVAAIPILLAGWDMNGQYYYGTDSMIPTSMANNVTFVGLSRGIGVGTGGSSLYNGWGGNGFMAYLPSTGIASNSFFTFSIQSNSGCLMSLAAINPFYYRKSSTGPTSGLFQYQINNGAFVSFDTLSFPSSSSSGALLSPIYLNGIQALQNMPPLTIITFRLVPYGASGSTGTFYIFDGISGSDFSVIGSVIALQPIITSNLTDSTVYGTNANYQITATNNPVKFNALNMPLGMTIDTIAGIINVSDIVFAGNYSIVISATNQSGTSFDTLIYTVTKALLTITASNQMKTYGSSMLLGTLGFSSNGLLNNDSIQAVLLISTGAINTAIPNVYSLIPSAASGFGICNYSIVYVNGLLTVNKGLDKVWVGVSNSNFNDSANWQDYQITKAIDNVVIHPVATNYPALNGNISLNNLLMDSATTLLVNKNTVLKVGGMIFNNNGLITMNGTIEFNGILPQTIPANCFNGNTIQNLSINNTSGVTVLGQLNVIGTVNPISGTLNTGGYLTLLSDSNSTGRVASGTGNYLNGNVKVERYVTPKSLRKYSFIGSSVTNVSIRNSWQQQIYITGNGIGGQTCGTTFGDGGSTDKYNSNGFDKTQTNTPSLFTYNGLPINGSRWVGINNTDSSNLIAGVGYKVNIRGDRNNGSCDNQLNQASPTSPNSVILSATGTLNMGNITVPLNDTSLQIYTLIANPYPSQISFSSFQSMNTLINNKFWSYSPFGNGNYTTCSQGVYANQATGYSTTSGDLITSGQAFFVEANGNGSVVFDESNKVDNAVPNTQYFNASVNQLIRIGLLSDTVKKALLDEVVLRFNQSGTKEYNNNWDAISFNSGNQVLTTIKSGQALSIATFPETNLSDTIQLAIASNSIGNFILSFSHLSDNVASATLLLHDKFLKSYRNLPSYYSFDVTSDTTSKGNNRFEVIVNQSSLPLYFINLTVKENNSTAQINWQVGTEVIGTIYELQQSLNGIDFNTISQISGTNTKNYSVKVPLKSVDKIYYRVKAVQINGIVNYSKIAVLLSSTDTPLFSIVSNQENNTLLIVSNNELNTPCSLRICTIEGKAISSLKVNTINKSILVNTQSLSSGIYIVTISNEKGYLYQSKFVKE